MGTKIIIPGKEKHCEKIFINYVGFWLFVAACSGADPAATPSLETQAIDEFAASDGARGLFCCLWRLFYLP